MSIFTIADLHLSAASNHPMDVFGSRWKNYTEKIRKGWLSVVKEEDTVVLPGDISWGMTLSEAAPDFRFIDSLPGKKLIGKGNHDFWWETAAKLNRFFEAEKIKSISLLYNNALTVENYVLAGTRGWFLDAGMQVTVGSVDYQKIVNREALRLKLSLESAKKLQQENPLHPEILVFLHFPPLFGDFKCKEILEVLKEYGVKRVFYGHIHGSYNQSAVTIYEGISLRLISSDYLSFLPFAIS